MLNIVALKRGKFGIILVEGQLSMLSLLSGWPAMMVEATCAVLEVTWLANYRTNGCQYRGNDKVCKLLFTLMSQRGIKWRSIEKILWSLLHKRLVSIAIEKFRLESDTCILQYTAGSHSIHAKNTILFNYWIAVLPDNHSNNDRAIWQEQKRANKI